MEIVRGNILATFLIIYVGRCVSQKFSLGACPTITAQTITLANPGIIGTWFEWSRTPNAGEHGWKCVTYTFSTVVTNQQLSIDVRGVHKLTGATKTATGTVTISGTVDGSNVLTGMLSVLFSNNKIIGGTTPLVYSVIGRDVAAAVEFITLYACRNFGIGKLEYVVILTNSRTPMITSLNAAFNAALSSGVASNFIKKTDQSGC